MESRKRAEQTTSDMKETLEKLHTRRIKLNEQTIKYRKWLKEKIELDKQILHNKKVKFNITLHQILKEREELFKKQGELWSSSAYGVDLRLLVFGPNELSGRSGGYAERDFSLWV